MRADTLSSNGLVRFGVFELDLRLGELRKGGVRLRLQHQAFLVLAALLERPSDLVTRDELRSRLWPADTFVDFDHGLNAVVRRLRETLGDSAVTPRFIETLPRRGYRFVAPVDRAHLRSRSVLLGLCRELRDRVRIPAVWALSAARSVLSVAGF